MKLGDIAQRLHGRLDGDPDLDIVRVAGIEHAQGEAVIHPGDNLMRGLFKSLEGEFRVVFGHRELGGGECVRVRGCNRTVAAGDGLSARERDEAKEGEEEFHNSVWGRKVRLSLAPGFSRV